jgi:hypothetical protein
MEQRGDRQKRTIWEASTAEELSAETLRVHKAARTVKKQALKQCGEPRIICHILNLANQRLGWISYPA